jgi:hypothetical protein
VRAVSGKLKEVQNIMKQLIQIALSSVMALALAGSAQAQPPGKDHRVAKAGNVSQIESLKKGDEYAVVCMECKTVTIKTVGAAEDAAALCHDGGTLHCAGCKSDATIKRVGPKGKQRLQYVNKDGKECMFVAPLNKK